MYKITRIRSFSTSSIEKSSKPIKLNDTQKIWFVRYYLDKILKVNKFPNFLYHSNEKDLKPLWKEIELLSKFENSDNIQKESNIEKNLKQINESIKVINSYLNVEDIDIKDTLEVKKLIYTCYNVDNRFLKTKNFIFTGSKNNRILKGIDKLLTEISNENLMDFLNNMETYNVDTENTIESINPNMIVTPIVEKEKSSVFSTLNKNLRKIFNFGTNILKSINKNNKKSEEDLKNNVNDVISNKNILTADKDNWKIEIGIYVKRILLCILAVVAIVFLSYFLS